MRLYLIRHGQTAWNVELRAQGHSDIPLDEEGHSQAESLCEPFSKLPITKVFTSDLSRSMDTARRIARASGAELVVTPELRERSLGDFEGLPFEELWSRLRQTAEGGDLFSARPPNGESMRETWDRLGPITAKLKSLDESAAIVSHGGSSALLLARLLAGTVETSRSFRFSNCAITEMERRPDGAFLLLRYNDTAHLTSAKPLAGSLDGSTR